MDKRARKFKRWLCEKDYIVNPLHNSIEQAQMDKKKRR